MEKGRKTRILWMISMRLTSCLPEKQFRNGLFWLAVVGAIIWLVVWAVRRSATGNWNSSIMHDRVATGSSAKDIAQMRYARGEISREEYQQLLEDLSR